MGYALSASVRNAFPARQVLSSVSTPCHTRFICMRFLLSLGDFRFCHAERISMLLRITLPICMSIPRAVKPALFGNRTVCATSSFTSCWRMRSATTCCSTIGANVTPRITAAPIMRPGQTLIVAAQSTTIPGNIVQMLLLRYLACLNSLPFAS